MIPENLLREPLDYLFADHVRIRALCIAINEFIQKMDSSPSPDDETLTLAGAISHYLRTELPLHTADEELDIFPLLRLRAQPEDNITEILDRLSEEHAKDEALAEVLISGLEGLSGTIPPAAQVKLLNAARSFAENHCRHMEQEDTVVLPLARKRLTQADMNQIGRTMANRRDLPYPD